MTHSENQNLQSSCDCFQQYCAFLDKMVEVDASIAQLEKELADLEKFSAYFPKMINEVRIYAAVAFVTAMLIAWML